MEFRKMVTITLYARQQRDTDVSNSLLDSVGEGERGMVWENGIETCKISYVKWIASPGSLHDRVLRAGALGGRWEGGSGWGTHVHPYQIHVNVWQNNKKITYFHLINDFLLVYGVYNMSFQMTVVLYDLAVFLLLGCKTFNIV